MFEQKISKNYSPGPSKVTQGNLVEHLLTTDKEEGIQSSDRQHLKSQIMSREPLLLIVPINIKPKGMFVVLATSEAPEERKDL